MSKNIPLADNMRMFIDGKEYIARNHYHWRGSMIEDVPNFGFLAGYFTASYTLKVDITNRFFCRILKQMDDIVKEHSRINLKLPLDIVLTPRTPPNIKESEAEFPL